MNFKKIVMFLMGLMMLVSMLATARADDSLQMDRMISEGKIRAAMADSYVPRLNRIESDIDTMLSGLCPDQGRVSASEETFDIVRRSLADRKRQILVMKEQLTKSVEQTNSENQMDVDKEITNLESSMTEDTKLLCAM